MRPSFPVEVGCPCGAVRYRLLEDPLELHVCHCMDCQRASGSAFVMTMSAPRQALGVVGRLATVSYETVEGFPRCDERGAVCYARLGVRTLGTRKSSRFARALSTIRAG
jgi:hypothetical protein